MSAGQTVTVAIWFVMGVILFIIDDIPRAQYFMIGAIFFVLINSQDKNKP